MKTMQWITMALLLSVGSSSAQAQDEDSCHRFDRTRGECSPGTDAPTRTQMRQVIMSGSPSALQAILEYGERVECTECVRLLQRRLYDNHPLVREMSAWWLRRRWYAMPAIMHSVKQTLVTDANPTRRAHAASAIGEFMDPRGLTPLRNAAMSDSSSEVRAAAVTALGRLNHPDGNAVIADAMSDADASVRLAAVSTVLRVNFFRDSGAMIALLADENAAIRARAASVLGDFREASAFTALAALLRSDTDWGVRQSAAVAIGKLGTPDARAALTEVRGTETNPRVLDGIEIALHMTQ